MAVSEILRKNKKTLPPFRKVNYRPINLDVKRRDDGAVLLRNRNPMGEPAAHLLEPFEKWAAEAPDRIWLAERPQGKTVPGQWIKMTYGEGLKKVRAAAAGLIELGAGPDAPLMVLSGNSIPHAVMTYAAAAIAAPVAPVSEGYSLMSSDYAKLHYVFNLIRPKVIFVEDYERYVPALNALDLTDVHIVSVTAPAGAQILSYDALLQSGREDEVEARQKTLHWDTVAKYLFTSGSTGMPKAVINTHGMMCVNAVMTKKLILDRENEVHTILSWLPWNHTYGGNAILNVALTGGSSYYLDRGRPLPGLFDETIAALKDIAPTTYGNVPAAYSMLVDALERDDALAENFFSRLQSAAYGGAALAQDIAERFQKVAMRITGERILFISGYGATETAPTIMSVHWETDRMGLLGLPVPGVDIKLQPVGGKMEVRAKGICITPGYYKNPQKTKDAFDEEGFYCLGDAARFVDESDPTKGLIFDGRVAEDFKLSTGTWVNAGNLRVNLLDAAGGLLRDAVIAGLDQSYIAVLGFPNMDAIRKFLKKEGEDSRLLRDPKLLKEMDKRLRAYNQKHRGSSTRVARILLLETPPDFDKGEITDKGYINQGRVLEERAKERRALYSDPPPPHILSLV